MLQNFLRYCNLSEVFLQIRFVVFIFSFCKIQNVFFLLNTYVHLQHLYSIVERTPPSVAPKPPRSSQPGTSTTCTYMYTCVQKSFINRKKCRKCLDNFFWIFSRLEIRVKVCVFFYTHIGLLQFLLYLASKSTKTPPQEIWRSGMQYEERGRIGNLADEGGTILWQMTPEKP